MSANCPVCRREPEDRHCLSAELRHYRYRCRHCGVFDATFPVVGAISQDFENHRHLIAGSIRELSEGGASLPMLSHDALDALVARAPTTNPEKLDRLLRSLAKRGAPGRYTSFNTRDDAPLAFADGEEECRFWIHSLRDQGLVELGGDLAVHAQPGPQGIDGTYRLTAKGWRKARELDLQGPSGMTAFVAMSFHADLRAAYTEAIEPAVREAGFEPLRIDMVEHVDRIDERIMVELAACRFVIADFSQHRPGVYFEAGYAAGRGIPVIWTCHENYSDSLHFDTRQFNHIVWNNHADLHRRLVTRIEFLIGQGNPQPLPIPQ